MYRLKKFKCKQEKPKHKKQLKQLFSFWKKLIFVLLFIAKWIKLFTFDAENLLIAQVWHPDSYRDVCTTNKKILSNKNRIFQTYYLNSI